MVESTVAVPNSLVSLNEAVSAWFAGEFQDAVEHCDAMDRRGEGTVDATLLRARALLRLNRCAEALEALEHAVSEHAESDSDLTRRMLIGVALTRLGDAERGLEYLRHTRAMMANSCGSLRSEVELSIGLAYYALHRLDSADAALDEVDARADVIHARSLEYKAWVACARGNYGGAATLFQSALTRLERCMIADCFLEVNCLQALAYLAVDGLDRRTWQPVSARHASLRWKTKGLGLPLFRISMSTATFENDVEGRPMRAAAEARRAYDLAPSSAYRIQALCKRASVARCAGERIAQNDHLQAAVDAFSELNVAELSSDELLAPLAIAEELANTDRAGEARFYFDTYCRHRPAIATLAISGDQRGETYEQLVAAQIAEAETWRLEASSLYRKVLTRSVSSSLRHGVIAAIRLANVAGDTSYLRGFAALAARDVRESSWIQDSLKRISGVESLSSLTKPQRECLTMMSRGYTNSQIASARGRSVNTVRNQIAVLFEVFGVRNRAQLIGAYLRWTRTDPDPRSIAAAPKFDSAVPESTRRAALPRRRLRSSGTTVPLER